MPITNDPANVRALLNRALTNGYLGQREAATLLREIKKDGVTDEETKALIDAFTQAAQSGVDLNAAHRTTINRLLGKLDALAPLPLDRARAERLPNGTLNFVGLLATRGQTPTTPVLPQKSFSGNDVGVDTFGAIHVGGKRQALNLNPPADGLLEGLWALSRPGQLGGLSHGAAAALGGQLAGAVEKALTVPQQDPDKLKRFAGTCASLATLAELAPRWDAATVDSMLRAADKVPTPLMKALILRGLDAAPLTDVQKAQRQALTAPDGMAELLAQFDSVRGEQAQAGYRPVKGVAAETALSAITFAKNAEAVKNVLETFKVWDGLNSDYQKPLDAEEVGHFKRVLTGYVQEYDQSAFVFGTLSESARKEVASVVSARTFDRVAPSLRTTPPSLEGFPLTRAQADAILTVLPTAKDDRAIERMVSALATANALFEPNLPSSWGSPSLPGKPMPAAAFKLFERAVTEYQDRAAASPDGKLAYDDFSREFRAQVEDIHKALAPRMAELGKTPPTWNGVQLSAEAAGYVQSLMQDRLRSSMSVDNIGRALTVFGDKHGGKIEGASFTAFKGMVEEYMAGWPDYSFFDFNKLERIASYKVEGRSVPLCSLNGTPVGLAEFYDKVALGVTGAVDKSRLLHPWQGDRWGFRARESVELLDVIAEKAARNEGPLALLRNTYPGKDIQIEATGRDGAHEQFIYVVKDGNRPVGRFLQGSDGTMAPTNQVLEPVLFTASVGSEGEVNVKVPTQIRADRYPLQTPYAVGDKIDLTYRDSATVELQKEGESFATQYKVVEAEILSFDGKGNYQVRLKTPGGGEETKTVTLNDIRRANNPHYFKPHGDWFSDVTINIKTDPELKSFLEGAQPIIDAHLPADGSTVNLSPKELAKKQRACIDALMDYAAKNMKYPADKTATHDESSTKYHEMIGNGWNRVPLGDLVKIERGVCRHQCILEHLLLQYAGIDSRLASGAANTSSNDFRGYHIWCEVQLADNERYLSDQTWSDVAIPLWSGAYSVDKRRAEMYDRTARYDRNIVMPG